MPAHARSELIEAAKQRVREAFAAFETKDGSAIADERDLGDVLRAAGANVSQAQVAQVLEVRTARASLKAAMTGAHRMGAWAHAH